MLDPVVAVSDRRRWSPKTGTCGSIFMKTGFCISLYDFYRHFLAVYTKQ